MQNIPLRIITFNFVPFAYNIVTKWIHESGNKHLLTVTTPGPLSRPTPQYKGIIENAQRDVGILVSTKLKTVVTPVVRALEPDLIVCFSFPYRITPELCAIPKYGAVNLHPAVLPKHRGPNAMRAIYDGSHEFGATAHWLAEDYDTGNILSQSSSPLPNEVTEKSLFSMWGPMLSDTLAKGLEKAIAGDTGIPQDDQQASYAAPFTEEEKWLSLKESRRVLERKVTALSFGGRGNAKLVLDGNHYSILSLEVMASDKSEAMPGECLDRDSEFITVQAGDGPLRLQVESLS